jgi:SAM-dependent methyltransferase
VAAVDPSRTFTMAAQARHPGVDVIVASAEVLPFPADEFDAALAQLVVHFMADPVVGIREMARVTVPGGVVAACVWDFAGGRGPLGPFWEAAAEIDPEVEDESWLAGARRGHLIELFHSAGLTELEAADLVAIREYPGFDAWWDPFTRGVGPGGSYVGSLDPNRREELRNRCRSMLPEGSFVLTAHAWAALGRVGHD